MKQVFNLRRIYNFLRHQLYLHFHSAVLSISAICGCLLIITIFYAKTIDGALYGLTGLFRTTLFITGFIFTSKIFAETNVPQKAYAYFTIPVSILEKLIASWILTAPLFLLIYSSLLALLVLLAGLVANQLPQFAKVFSGEYLNTLMVYLIGQTIFLLGASFFKKSNFVKTILSVIMISIGLGMFITIVGYLVFRGSDFSFGFENLEMTDVSENFRLLHKIFFYLFGPLMLVITYFKLKEKQI